MDMPEVWQLAGDSALWEPTDTEGTVVWRHVLIGGGDACQACHYYCHTGSKRTETDYPRAPL